MSEQAENEMARFIEGEDYYFDKGLMVLTESYLRSRGYCCGSGCRHCPYTSEERAEAMSKKKLL